MPSPEFRREGPHKEQETQPAYYQAARYTDEQTAGNAYLQAQDALFQTNAELSAYRF